MILTASTEKRMSDEDREKMFSRPVNFTHIGRLAGCSSCGAEDVCSEQLRFFRSAV